MAVTAPVSAVIPAAATAPTPLATVPRPDSRPLDRLTPPSIPAVIVLPKAFPAFEPALPNSPQILPAKPSMDGMSVMHAEPTLVAIQSS